MAVKTTTTYSCDRCARESDSPDFSNGTKSGRARIKLKGQEAVQSYDGAWGGHSYDKSSELCFSCAREFRSLFSNFMAQKESKDDCS